MTCEAGVKGGRNGKNKAPGDLKRAVYHTKEAETQEL